MRPVPQAAVDLVKVSEGFRAQRNTDPVGLAEIGYGHKMPPTDPMWDASLSEAEAEALALDDLDVAGCELQNVLGPQQVSLFTDGQWAALLDFVFNLGIGTFEGSTLCRLIRMGQLQAAGGEFNRWIHAGNPPVVLPGLVTRRAAETALWVS